MNIDAYSQSERDHWKLRIESEDDLWVLARLASNGRHLAMLGERRDTTTAESVLEQKRLNERKCGLNYESYQQSISPTQTSFVFMEQLYSSDGHRIASYTPHRGGR